MQKAWERKRKFNKDGQCIEDEWSIGAIVPWGIVALAAVLLGKALVNLPAGFWDFLKR